MFCFIGNVKWVRGPINYEIKYIANKKSVYLNHFNYTAIGVLDSM